MQNKKAVFLDRDGTLIEDRNYLSNPRDISFLQQVPESLKKLKQQGFLLILITNQSGVGRGYFSLEKLQEIHEELQRRLKNQGVSLDAIYFCPHVPDDGCKCRKPESALFTQAIQEHAIDPNVSYAIGDKLSDVSAAKKVGCKTILLADSDHNSNLADYHTPSFAEATRWIIHRKDDL